MLSYLTLIRPFNCLMACIAVFIGGLIVANTGMIFGMDIYIAMLAAFLITGAGNVINDYVDVESDKINRSGRPIVSGRVSKNSALIFCLFLFFLGIALTLFFGTIYPFLIAVVNSLLLIFYSTDLQYKIFVGNIVISYLVGSTFLFGGAALGNMLLPLLLMLLASLSNFSREIVKDFEDIEGDKKTFLKNVKGVKKKIERFEVTRKGVKLKYNKRKAVMLAQLSLLIAVILSPLPYLWDILGYSYLFFVILTDIAFVYAVYRMIKSKTKQEYGQISKLIKTGMFLGLIAFIAGALI